MFRQLLSREGAPGGPSNGSAPAAGVNESHEMTTIVGNEQKRSSRLSEWFKESEYSNGRENSLRDKFMLTQLFERVALTDSPEKAPDGTPSVPPPPYTGLDPYGRKGSPLGELTPAGNRPPMNTPESFLKGSPAGSPEGSRVVLLTGIELNTSLSSIMASIYGGPLKSVDIVRQCHLEPIRLSNWNDTIPWDRCILRLEFQSQAGAARFFNYSLTGSFLVNGSHPDSVWAPPLEMKSTDDYEHGHGLISEPECARRVLVLKRPVPLKKKASTAGKKKMVYPDPMTNFSPEFDVDQIIRDFASFGRIVEVTPVISRKLCFGVQFYDVKAAAAAKRSVEGHLDGIHDHVAARYHGWYVWYGKDPCEKVIPT